MKTKIAVLLASLLAISGSLFAQTKHGRIQTDAILNSQIITITGATPTVVNGNVFKTANGGSTTITNFLGSVNPQRITVICGDTNTSIANNATIVTVTGATLPCASLNQAFDFEFDPSQPAWVQVSGGGVGGSGCTVSGNNGDVQIKNGAGCTAGGINDNGTVAAIKRDASFLLNPYIDLRQYGARKMTFNATPAIPGVTATIANGSNSVTVSTQSCPSQFYLTICFIGTDAVTIANAGTNHSMVTPVAPTLTPVLNGVVTGIPAEQVNAPNGAVTYNAKIFEFNEFGGWTASSPTATITTSNTLGMQNVGITSCARTNDQVTCTTSAAHGLPVGCIATPNTSAARCPTVYQLYTGMSDLGFAGEKAVQSVADNTHYTYTDNLDTRNGASSGGTGGTVYWGQAVHYVLPSHSANGMFYGICSDRGSPGTFNVIGVTWPLNLTTGNYPEGTLEFNDWGATMGGTPANMWSIPTVCPTSAAANNLSTTLTGANGVNLTTATAAGNGACASGGCAIVIDTQPILATVAAANPNNPIMFAPDTHTGTFYIFNSTMDFSSFFVGPSLVGGFIRANAPLILGNASWRGGSFRMLRSGPSFTYDSYPPISCSAKPCVWIANGANGFGEFGGFEIDISGSQNISILEDGEAGAPGLFLHDIQAGVGSDLVGQAFVCRTNPSAGCAVYGSRISLFANQTGEGSTLTPLVYVGQGEVRFDQFSTSGRHILTRGSITIGYDHLQAGITPFVTVTGLTNGGVTAATLNLGTNGGIVMDTISHAAISYQPGLGGSIVNATYNGNTPSANVPLFTGQRIALSQNNGLGTQFQNRDAMGQIQNGRCTEPIFAGNNGPPVNCYPFKVNTYVQMAPTYSFFVDSLPPSQPTCTPSAGGGVTNGSYIFAIMPVWGNGAEGLLSPFSATCVAGSGNNTLTLAWSQLSVVPLGWNIYQSNGGGAIRIRNTGGVGATSCVSPQITGTTTSITLIANTNCGFGPANSSAGGPVTIGGTLISTPNLQLLQTPFASLGTPVNGTQVFCPDCTIANPCAGSGTGALAKRLNGIWVCN